MSINENYTGYDGTKYIFDYYDADSFGSLDYSRCKQAYGVCFYGDKIVIGFGGHENAWSFIGGTIENNETFEQALKREIQEESNMEILSFIPIGYQKVTNIKTNSYIYQLRYVCKVKPYGPFVSDPANGVKEIKIIDPKEYKKYFNWGKIGERIMKRALELKSKLN